MRAHRRLSSLELPLPLEYADLWDSIRSTRTRLVASRDTLAHGRVLKGRMSMRLTRSVRLLATGRPSTSTQQESESHSP